MTPAQNNLSRYLHRDNVSQVKTKRRSVVKRSKLPVVMAVVTVALLSYSVWSVWYTTRLAAQVEATCQR
jgi:hypothetical protein